MTYVCIVHIAIYLNWIYASCTAITRLITLASYKILMLETAIFNKTLTALFEYIILKLSDSIKQLYARAVPALYYPKLLWFILSRAIIAN